MSISLNDHEKRIKNIDSQIVTIGDRITAVENRPGTVLVTLGYSGQYGRPGITLNKPSNVIGMNYIIKSLSLQTANNNISTDYSLNNGTISVGGYDGQFMRYVIADNGSSITIRSSENSSKGMLRLNSGIVFLFYK